MVIFKLYRINWRIKCREEKIMSKYQWMRLLVLVFGMTVIGCDNGTTSGIDVSIEGDKEFIRYTQEALDIISTSPEDYVIVQRYIGVIRQGTSSGMWAWLKPPTFVVGYATYSSSSTWYASCIIHEAAHSRQYHQYLALHGYVPDEVWTGFYAEMEALEIQIAFLIRIGAPDDEIRWAESHRDNPWWDGTICWNLLPL